mgnify:CR=1 FL=1
MEKLIDSLETLEVKIKEVKQAQKVFSTYRSVPVPFLL